MSDRGTLPPRGQITQEKKLEALREVNRSGRRVEAFWQWAQSFIIAVVLFFIMRAFVVEAFKIPSGSMESTLRSGDFLLVNKMLYGAEVPFTGKHLPRVREPQRGDVVVFRYPGDPRVDYVKRLVGLPGDTLAMHDGRLWVNGVPRTEQYAIHIDRDDDPVYADFEWQREYFAGGAEAARLYRPTRNNWGPLVVPGGNYFMLGDNRDNSSDSRYWGFVPDSLLRGRPMLVYYSYAPDSSQHFPWLTGIRWRRIFERIR
jgi:signal peptidase I